MAILSHLAKQQKSAIKPASVIEQKRLSLPLEAVGTDGTFSGYASLFGHVDLGKDRVEKGAFRKSLKERTSNGIRMLFQHDPSEPIGTWDEIKEDERGLFVRGRIAKGSARASEVLSLLRERAVDGLSIGFRTERSRTDRKTGVRSILQADLWEISVVTFPMLPQARVGQVKNSFARQHKSYPTKREFERWLTQDAGFTRSEARTVMSEGFATLARKRDAASQSDCGLVRLIRQAAQSINANTK